MMMPPLTAQTMGSEEPHPQPRLSVNARRRKNALRRTD